MRICRACAILPSPTMGRTAGAAPAKPRATRVSKKALPAVGAVPVGQMFAQQVCQTQDLSVAEGEVCTESPPRLGPPHRQDPHPTPSPPLASLARP